MISFIKDERIVVAGGGIWWRWPENLIWGRRCCIFVRVGPIWYFVGKKGKFVDINTKLIQLDGYCCNILGSYLIMAQMGKYVAITCH